MEEFLLVDDDFCGNCSNKLSSTNVTSGDSSPKIYNLDIVVHTVQENKSLSVACEKVSVFTAIKDLLSCQIQISETDRVTADGVIHSDNENLNPTYKINEHSSNVNVQVPLCLPCSLLLQELYRSFKLFQSLRDETSYISKLTHRIQQTFPIPKVRHINDTDYDHGIQFGEERINESEVQTFEDPFGEETDVKVDPFAMATVATGANLSPAECIIVGTGVENAIRNPLNVQVQSSSFLLIANSSATGTNIKAEIEVDKTVYENDFGLTQEEMMEAAIRDIATQKVDPLRSIKCGDNSAAKSFIQTARTTTKSGFDLDSSTHEEFALENNESDDDSNRNKRRRSGRLRSKLEASASAPLSTYYDSTSTMQSDISTVSESSDDGNYSYNEIKTIYESNSCPQPTKSKSNLQINPKNQIEIINTYTVDEAVGQKLGTSHEEVRLSQNQKPNFKCPYCPKMLYSQSGMTYHMASHTRERLYQCEFCEHEFVRMDSKRSHELTCKNRPDGLKIKPYNCHFCMRPFTTQSARASHQRICQNRPDGLKIKLFNCVYCERPFAQSSSKLSHERVCEQRPDGLKIKPYQCRFCRSKMFSKISGKRTHERACKMRPGIPNPLVK